MTPLKTKQIPIKRNANIAVSKGLIAIMSPSTIATTAKSNDSHHIGK